MPSHLRNIIFKEIREILRDPRLFLSMVIVPLILFPVMGFAMSAAITSTTSELETREFNLVVVDQDHGPYSLVLVGYINESISVTPIPVDIDTFDDQLDYALEMGADALMVIPPTFSSSLENGTRTNLSLHTIMRTTSITEGFKDAYVLGLLGDFKSYLVLNNILETNTTHDPIFFLDPMGVEENAVIQGRSVPYSPGTVQGFFMGQTMMVPIILMMLIIMAAQLAAVTVASEKEEKTLETLLTLPVSRTTIMMGKISGVALMSMVAALTYMVGFLYYMNTLMSMETDMAAGITFEELGMTLNPMAVAVLGACIILTLLSALSLAVLLAAFTEDVRSAQSLTGILVIPIIIPAFILMMADVSILPGAIQAVVFAIPFSYPMLAANGLFSPVPSYMVLGLFYQAAFTLGAFYAAGRLFSTEKIFTAKLNMKRKS